MLGSKDPTKIQGKPQESDDPYGQAPGDSGEEKLPFNRKQPSVGVPICHNWWEVMQSN